ncbi:MAG: hypothetical protein KGZ83_00655 [Sulfuricella sp.]|nr:hypothetical protein [Sulfuricella sp.]
MDNLLENTIRQATASIGADPDGWDKPMSKAEFEHFMKFDNNDRSIETVYLGPSDDGNKIL